MKISLSKLSSECSRLADDECPTYFVIPDKSVDEKREEEKIVITKSMKLEFDKNINYGNRTIVIEDNSQVEIRGLNYNGCVIVKRSVLRIENSTFSNPPKGIDYMLLSCDKSRAVVENCNFQHTDLYGVGVDSSSILEITNSQICDCKQLCISVTGESSCSCVDTVIDKSEIELITVEVKSRLILKKCILKNAVNSAVFLYDSFIKAYETTFELNGKGAISIREGYNNLLYDCKIVDSNDTAILLESGSIVVEKTSIVKCNGNGINAQLNSRAIVRNCTFSDAKWPLAAFCDGSTGIVSNTLFEISAMSGFIIRGESDVLVDGCTIRNCAEAGIRISDSRNVKFTNCIVTDCQFSGIEICDNSFCTISDCIFAGSFEIGINIYSAASASVSNTSVIGPFNSAIWAHYGGYGQFANIIINNLQLPLKLESIQPFVAHMKAKRIIEKSPPIIEFFDYLSCRKSEGGNNSEVSDEVSELRKNFGDVQNGCDPRFFKIETQWFVSATHCFIFGIGPYELVANPTRKKLQANMGICIPADCIKCGKPANDMHFSPCGHSLYCFNCWSAMKEKERPQICPICHLPVEKGVQRVNCGIDDDVCGICYTSKVDTIILPCGHTICKECANKWFVESAECPFCREQRAQIRALVSYA